MPNPNIDSSCVNITHHIARWPFPLPQEVQHDVPDPGAVGVARWLAGIAQALQ